MKKYFKLTLSLILVLAMVLQLSAVAFAANIGLINHETNELKVTATVAVRGLSSEAKLVTAVYDASGSVVDYDVSESAENAKDAFLKTTVEKEAESNTVKSFIWNADDKATPLTVAADLAVATEADVEIYFDGVPFATAAGEALSFSKDTYTVKLSDTDADGDIDLPKITYKTKDSSIDVDVATDYEAMQSVITIGSGARIVDTRTVHNPNDSANTGKDTTKAYYSREAEEVITINYDINELVVSDFVENGTTGGIAGSTTKYYDHVKSYDTAGKVTLQVKGVAGKTSVLVIVPKTSGTDKNTVLYQDSTPINWVKDSGVITAYDYDSAYADNRLLEPFVEERATYGQLSAYQGMAEGTTVDPNNTTVDGEKSVIHEGYTVKMYKVADGAEKAVYVPVYDKFVANDHYLVSGSRVTNGGTREPVSGGLGFYMVNSTLLGCNYIAIPSAGYTCATTDDMIFEFYVDEPVDVHVVTQSATVYFDGSATGDTVSRDTTIATRYQDLSKYLPCAYWVANKMIDMTDLMLYSTSNSYSETYTQDDVTYTYASAASYKIRKYAFFMNDALTGNKSQKAYTLTPELIQKYDIATPNATTPTKLEKFISVAEIAAKVKEIEEAPVALVTDVARPTETVTYNGATINMNDNNLPLPVPEIFDAEDTNQSIAMDRLGLKDTSRYNGTGSISSYPGSYDLDDAIFLQSNIKYDDGSSSAIACMYNNYEKVDSGEKDKDGKTIYIFPKVEEDYIPRPLYTFKVNRPAEIIVFCGDEHPGLVADGYGYVLLDAADSLQYTYSGSQIRNMRHVYTREVQPGTITMKTPGNSGLYVVFVKELNK